MFKLKGTIKRIDVKDVTNKDGQPVKVRTLVVEPENDVFPVLVKTNDTATNYGKEGDKIDSDIKCYPWHWEEGKGGGVRKQKSNLDIYIPKRS